MNFTKAINLLLNYWKQFCLLFSVFGSLSIYLLGFIFPVIKIDTKWLASFVYLGLISLIFIVLEIRNFLLVEKKPQVFENMRAAENNIIELVMKATKKKKVPPVNLKVVGNRLSRISPILSDIFRIAKENKLGQRHIFITIYHIDPTVIDDFFFPNVEDRKELIKKHKTFSENLNTNINWLKESAKETEFIDIRFVSYRRTPYFYGYLIDGVHLFWGYFSWDKEAKDWIGPSNPCFYMKKHSEVLKGFVDWVENRLSIYEELQLNSEPADQP